MTELGGGTTWHQINCNHKCPRTIFISGNGSLTPFKRHELYIFWVSPTMVHNPSHSYPFLALSLGLRRGRLPPPDSWVQSRCHVKILTREIQRSIKQHVLSSFTVSDFQCIFNTQHLTKRHSPPTSVLRIYMLKYDYVFISWLLSKSTEHEDDWKWNKANMRTSLCSCFVDSWIGSLHEGAHHLESVAERFLVPNQDVVAATSEYLSLPKKSLRNRRIRKQTQLVELKEHLVQKSFLTCSPSMAKSFAKKRLFRAQRQLLHGHRDACSKWTHICSYCLNVDWQTFSDTGEPRKQKDDCNGRSWDHHEIMRS